MVFLEYNLQVVVCEGGICCLNRPHFYSDIRAGKVGYIR